MIFASVLVVLLLKSFLSYFILKYRKLKKPTALDASWLHAGISEREDTGT